MRDWHSLHRRQDELRSLSLRLIHQLPCYLTISYHGAIGINAYWTQCPRQRFKWLYWSPAWSQAVCSNLRPRNSPGISRIPDLHEQGTCRQERGHGKTCPLSTLVLCTYFILFHFYVTQCKFVVRHIISPWYDPNSVYACIALYHHRSEHICSYVFVYIRIKSGIF